MICPFCQQRGSIVKDSRELLDGTSVRRRRACLSCQMRFTTFERIEMRQLCVLKRSGLREPFDSIKIERSVGIAIDKCREHRMDLIRSITQKVIERIKTDLRHPISTKKIGDLILNELFKVDQLSCVRFASVYKNFHTLDDITRFISHLKAVNRKLRK
ncbi:NrdR-like transcriptional regulator [Rickettsiales endosymbiont of Paramecium tredecaurelia]|uniref:NrdR family transcriptional regulator n=1 Tax=Candidatus Sarmatiella mevalonica TaxID=2770581 RepID=UPI001924AA67|nr:ATP cone domain-containing protein [Candidatus Sarmatiella mevalonica]MBL3284511.1 NrdR-like transcriptional regulator [Candidatus Sarmatiella mevalonica]